jgi:hypothetical protein
MKERKIKFQTNKSQRMKENWGRGDNERVRESEWKSGERVHEWRGERGEMEK